jgi:hypothetical protein
MGETDDGRQTTEEDLRAVYGELRRVARALLRRA